MIMRMKPLYTTSENRLCSLAMFIYCYLVLTTSHRSTRHGSSLAKKALSLLDSLRTPDIVSEAVVINSDSPSMTSLNVFTFSVLELSQTYLLILTQKALDELALKGKVT